MPKPPPRPRFDRARAEKYAGEIARLIEPACEELTMVVPEMRTVTTIVANVVPKIAEQYALVDMDDDDRKRDLLRECVDRLVKAERLEKVKGDNGRFVWSDSERHARFRAADGSQIVVVIKWPRRQGDTGTEDRGRSSRTSGRSAGFWTG